MALQSQLDICSVKRIQKRKLFFQALVKANDILRFTNVAVASLRGISLLGGPLGKLASSMGEKALLRWNHLTAKKQDFFLRLMGLEEKNLLCGPTKHSRAFARCELSPPLSSLLYRATPSMPDLVAPYLARHKTFGQVICRKGRLKTELLLFGDATLIHENFREVYAK